MIEKLQKISAELFKNALKSYTAKDVLIHKNAHDMNVPELMSLYPNKGQGFIIRKKDWAEGLFYQIKRAQYKSHRNGTFYGLKNIKNQRQQKTVEEYPQRLHGLSKRGVWTYELGTFSTFKNDNGVVYNRNDYQAFLLLRKVGQRSQKNKSSGEQAKQEITPPESYETQ